MSPLLPRRAVSIGLAVSLLGAGLVGLASAAERPPRPASTAVAAAEVGRTPLPVGSDERGLAGVERSAVDLAAALDAVPVRAEGDEATRYCDRADLRVRWSAPLPDEFVVGGHIDPVGPAPTSQTDAVNGLVVCTGSSFAYMGFEARWDGVSWTLAAVPALSDEHELESGAAEPEPVAPVQAPRAPAPRAAAPAPGFVVPPGDGIDGYAAYDPQRVCDPAAKPGTVGLRDLLLRTYPGTRSLGVSRTCTARGTSEHKEGRAFDWGVDKGQAAERAAAHSLLSQLLATDPAGHRHALARRLGVMYLIWDRQIWSAYSADRGWRPYNGANAHTDHVHISLSWDGAMGRTSYWSGANARLLKAGPELRLATVGTASSTASSAVSSAVSSSSAPRAQQAGGPPVVRRTRQTLERAPSPRASGERQEREQTRPAEPDRWEQERRQRAERRKQAREARRSAAPRPTPSTPAVTDTVALDLSSPSPRAQRVERPRPERSKAERPRPQRSKVERPRPQRSKVERPRPQRSKVERPRPQRSKVERPRPQRSKAERPRPQRSKAERKGRS